MGTEPFELSPAAAEKVLAEIVRLTEETIPRVAGEVGVPPGAIAMVLVEVGIDALMACTGTPQDRLAAIQDFLVGAAAQTANAAKHHLTSTGVNVH